MKSKNMQSILLFDEIASHIDGKNLELFFDEISKNWHANLVHWK